MWRSHHRQRSPLAEPLKSCGTETLRLRREYGMCYDVGRKPCCGVSCLPFRSWGWASLILNGHMLNIPYRWGGVNPEEGLDCFTLASYIRMKHGRSPLPNHNWVYQTFEDETFPPRLMLELLEDAFGPGVTRSPQSFDLVALAGQTVCLGTVFGDSVVHFNDRKVTAITPLGVLRRSRSILGIWDPDRMRKTEILHQDAPSIPSR